jgi:hypothetical protein
MRFTVRLGLKVIVGATVLAAPIATWSLWKPIRALAPELAGVKCYEGAVCTDAPNRVDEARELRNESLRFVTRKAGAFQAAPTMIFCSTIQCEKSFGFRGNAAYSLGASRLVVSSRGWLPFYVRHELIHCVQVERIGGFRMLLQTPTWLIEGMAYSLSEDPRRPLTEPWEAYRRQFEIWAAEGPPEELWQRAAAL